MPSVAIAGSPLLPGTTPIALHVRDTGDPDATPLLVLHGGWGYAFYPFDVQIAELADHRIVIPDRTGYGRSPRLMALPPRFHHAAAVELAALLDALGIERCAIWGHSDGAVIAALMAIEDPARYSSIILEAVHLDRTKPRSREFFTTMAENPDGFGERVTARLAEEHGDDSWRSVLRAGGRAWLDIAATPEDDLYDRRLTELAVPTLVLHGADDPRTEPGELDRIRRDVPHAAIEMIAGAGHSPHSECAAAATSTAIAAAFLRANR